MKNTLKIIAINFAILCTLIICMELISQFVYRAINGNFLFLEDVGEGRAANGNIFEIHPYLAGRLRASVVAQQNNKTIKSTNHHTRWTGANEDDNDLIRIAILGGSTTFGTGVTDEESWPYLLQTKLGKQFAVINYGVPGYSTAEAIIQMALIVPEKRPHLVMFYEGWNDIKNYHEKGLGADYYLHGMSQYGNLGISIFQSKLNAFATVRLIEMLINKIKKPSDNIEQFDEPDLFVDKIYLRNLSTLKVLADEINSSVLFIPQVLNYSSYHGGYGWTKHIKNDAMPTLMKRLNTLLNGLCSHGNSNCVVLNEVEKVKWVQDDFIDDGHFSKKGGLKMAEVVAQYVRNISRSEIPKNPTEQGLPLGLTINGVK